MCFIFFYSAKFSAQVPEGRYGKESREILKVFYERLIEGRDV